MIRKRKLVTFPKILACHTSSDFLVFNVIVFTTLLTFFLQGIEYQTAMECLQKADRRSLLAEIRALHSQMSIKKTTLKTEQEIDQPSQGML